MQWLAGNGGSATQPSNGGMTPLWTAASEGHLDVVQWLAGNGGSVTPPDREDLAGGELFPSSPLWIAANEGEECITVFELFG